jgi:orotate phosphoribosyltransferase
MPLPNHPTVQLAVSPSDAVRLFSAAGALLNGHFLLSSGLHSAQYFQCATLLENPPNAEALAKAMAPLCKKLNAETVVSPALGAILFGYELSRVLGVRNVFAERPEGKFELRRGFSLRPGERVILAENVVTTGGSVLEVADMVRSLGAVVAGYAVIVDRSGGKFSPEEPVVAYAAFQAETYAPDACPLCQAGSQVTKPGSRKFQAV